MKAGDLVQPLLIVGGGYLIYQYLQSSGLWAQWFGGVAPSSGVSNLLPGAVITAPVIQSPAGSILLHDNTGGSSFHVGDSFTLTVTGPPNSPVMITATQNGNAIGTSQLGTTDASGRLIVTNNWQAAHAGNWVEQVTVAGQQLPLLTFTVLPASGAMQGAPGSSQLSGIVPVPNYGAVRAPASPQPVPSMSFNRGFGGGFNAGRGRSNKYVQ